MRRALVPLLGLLAALPASPARAQAPPARGQVRIAHLRPAGPGDPDLAARPDLLAALRARPGFAAAIIEDFVDPADPKLARYPVVFWQARTPVPADAPGLAALRRHLTDGGGTLLADAAGGDAAARRMIAELLPGRALEPIPPGDPLHAPAGGFDLAAGGKAGPPGLEGVKVDGRWAVVYSRLDLGPAPAQPDAPAAKVAANVVRYATLP